MQSEKTVESCFMLPVRREMLGSMRDFWDDANGKYSTDIDGHLKLASVRKAQVFLQTMPDEREYMVMYLQSRNSLEKTFSDIFGADLKCSSYLARKFGEFTGIDLSKPENVPQPELLVDWAEPREFLEERQMLQMPWCMAMPIQPGKTDDFLRLIDDVTSSRMDEIEKMLRDREITRAIRYLQRTPQGDFLIGYMLASNTFEEIAGSLASCTGAMCGTIKNAVKEFFGLDLSDPKTLPDLKLLFKWDDTAGFQTAEQTIAYTE